MMAVSSGDGSGSMLGGCDSGRCGGVEVGWGGDMNKMCSRGRWEWIGGKM